MVASVSALIAPIDNALVRGSKRRGCRACTARRMFSPTLNAGNRLVIWNERPMPARAISSGVCPAIGWPISDTAPSSGGYMPDNRLNAVVLPAPLGPISACRVRSAIEMSMPRTALMPPKLLTMWRGGGDETAKTGLGREKIRDGGGVVGAG